jgi:hypothetical protein
VTSGICPVRATSAEYNRKRHRLRFCRAKRAGISVLSSMICPLCGARKAKRACPALGRQICAVCCGTKRLTEITCPASCSYLSAARTHPPAVVQRRQERDARFLLPLLSDLTDSQYQMLLFFQAIVLQYSSTAIPPLIDQEVSAAATAMAATLETARKGIIYQHQPASLSAQRLVSQIEIAFKELLSRAESRSAALEREAIIALRRIAKVADAAQRALPEDEPPVFIKLIGRLMGPANRNAGATSAVNSAEAPPGPLIIPG